MRDGIQMVWFTLQRDKQEKNIAYTVLPMATLISLKFFIWIKYPSNPRSIFVRLEVLTCDDYQRVQTVP